MIFLEWKEEYLTNISELDAQHQKLVALINEFYADLLKYQDNDKKKEIIIQTLNELVDYSCYHFDAEENLMRRHEYPEYAQHKEEHERFKTQVARFMKEQVETTHVAPFPIVVFLRDWLTSHIMKTDKQYGPYLNEKLFRNSKGE
jgi:hemerythrin